jgi:CheY-like chemotaxis protein
VYYGSVEHRRALIVDDNAINRELLSFILEAADFQVQTTDQAETALDLANNFQPDLLIFDVQLPGISGLELTRSFRSRPEGKRPCIISVTSYAMESDRERAFAAGCDGYITKPIDTRTFADEVRTIMCSRANGKALGANA